MNKKNIILIICGVMLLSVQLYVKPAGITIDICNDVAAFVLIIIGGLPLCNRNKVFKKMRLVMFIGLILTVFGQIIGATAPGDAVPLITGLSTIGTIYFTYYLTEGLVLESVFQDKSAVTRNFRIVWMFYGIFIFATFILMMQNLGIFVQVAQILTGIYAIYYCSVLLSGCKQLYMEGLPTKHMEEQN